MGRYSEQNGELVERILRYRAAHRMNQRAFAEYANVSAALIAHLETAPDRRIRMITRKRLEMALDDYKDQE